MTDDAIEAQPSRTARYLAAAGLFLLAPLVGEFLLGNLPITFLGALVALAPLYGGGALLIREIGRRAGLGWPGMLLLCLAFGIIEEAFVTQSLFNLDYLGLGLGHYAEIPGIGMGAWWTLFVLGLHTVWSTAVPIAIVETIFGVRRTEPWLGRPGLALAALLFAAGCAMTMMFDESAFMAAPHQFILAAVVVVALVVGAFMFRHRPVATGSGAGAPRPAVAAIASLVAGSLFVGLAYLTAPEYAWISTVLMAGVAAVSGWLLARWSGTSGWDQRHRFGVASGLVGTYIWFGFVQVPSLGGADLAIDLAGNAVFSLAALVLLAVGWARLARETKGVATGQT